MKTTRSLVNGLLMEESGQDLVEYGFIAGLVALASIVALSGLSHTLANVLVIIDCTLHNSV